MTDLFHSLIFVPIYNLLIALTDVLPGGDLGLSVIATTVAIKLALVPLSVQAVRTQKAMRALEPELKELRERYKDDKQQQAQEMFALYKKHGVRPFASILMLFIQIPVVLGLYFVCLNVASGTVDPSLIYSFVPAPEAISPLFLGFFSVAGTSVVLALIAGVSQAAQAWYAIPVPKKKENGAATMQEEFGRAVALQARFALPVLIGFFALASGALALYFATSSLFMIAQEFFMRLAHKQPLFQTPA